MKLTLGFSTCPNDTFIFDAMIHHKIDTEGLSFDVKLGDVEELNKLAFSSEIDMTKISYHAYAHIANNYILLNSGSALGRNNGPLLIAKKDFNLTEIEKLRIAIPGKNTTANLLFGLRFPKAKNKTEYLFSDIEEAVLKSEVDVGLIIHENRFTYKEKGLIKLMDMGQYWEKLTGLPIPLGGIVINRKHTTETQKKVDRVLQRSIRFAFENPKESFPFIKKYAQEMQEDVMYKHINLYVNNFTENLGEEGRNAVLKLYETAGDLNIIPLIEKEIFVETSK